MHRQFNGLKTAALLGLLSAIIIGAGALFGPRGLFIGLLLALGTNAYAYWNSDKLALRAMRARPVSEAEAPAIYAIVRELSTAAHQPMPRLYVTPTKQPNAFATGRNPRNAAVCVTDGILQILTARELRAVLGHELSHVYNRDILISSVAGALASVIMFLSHLAIFAPFFGGGRTTTTARAVRSACCCWSCSARSPRRSSSWRSAAAASTRPTQSGAELTDDPLALASALRKLAAGTAALPLPQEDRIVAQSHLMIANPFRPTGLAKLFSTHPPMEERIHRLEEMARQRGRY